MLVYEYLADRYRSCYTEKKSTTEGDVQWEKNFTFAMNATGCMRMKHIIVKPVDVTVLGLSRNRNCKEKK